MVIYSVMQCGLASKVLWSSCTLSAMPYNVGSQRKFGSDSTVGKQTNQHEHIDNSITITELHTATQIQKHILIYIISEKIFWKYLMNSSWRSNDYWTVGYVNGSVTIFSSMNVSLPYNTMVERVLWRMENRLLSARKLWSHTHKHPHKYSI